MSERTRTTKTPAEIRFVARQQLYRGLAMGFGLLGTFMSASFAVRLLRLPIRSFGGPIAPMLLMLHVAAFLASAYGLQQALSRKRTRRASSFILVALLVAIPFAVIAPLLSESLSLLAMSVGYVGVLFGGVWLPTKLRVTTDHSPDTTINRK